MQQAVESTSPVIAKIALVHHEAALKILVLLMADVNEFFNVGKPMGDTQAVATARLILADPEMKNLRPEDFKVCFDKGKSGHYGPVYDRVDGNTFFEWLRAYVAERLDYCEANSIIRHNEAKKAPNVIPEELVKMYHELARLRPGADNTAKIAELLEGDNLVAGSAKREKTPRPEKSPRDQFIQECFREFDKLAGDQEGKRFIDYLGKKVDEVEYVTERVTEYDKSQIP